MYIGQRIGTRFKDLVLAETSDSDSVLYGLDVSKSRQRAPDIYNKSRDTWWDLTTEADWDRGTHQRRYGDWGNGYEGIFW